MKTENFISILQNAGISESLIKSALHQLHLFRRIPGADYARILRTLAVDRRKVNSNRNKWGADMVSTYQLYIDLLDKVKEKIEQAQLMYPTLADATRAAYAENDARLKQGKKMGAACGARWQTWVPPHIRQQVMGAFDKAYAARGSYSGRRMTPFINNDDKKRITAATLALTRIIKGRRELYRDGGQNTASTPYRALQLLACRDAEKELERVTTGYQHGYVDPVDHPLPVNWRALLSPEMRTRLREADASPGQVTTKGLGQFLVPVEDNEDDIERDDVLSRSAVREWDDLSDTYDFDTSPEADDEEAEIDTFSSDPPGATTTFARPEPAPRDAAMREETAAFLKSIGAPTLDSATGTYPHAK